LLRATIGVLFVILLASWIAYERAMTSIDEVTRTLADAGVRSGISAARLEAVLDSLGVLHAPFSDSVVHAKFQPTNPAPRKAHVAINPNAYSEEAGMGDSLYCSGAVQSSERPAMLASVAINSAASIGFARCAR
jgi:hypothetical protein